MLDWDRLEPRDIEMMRSLQYKMVDARNFWNDPQGINEDLTKRFLQQTEILTFEKRVFNIFYLWSMHSFSLNFYSEFTVMSLNFKSVS